MRKLQANIFDEYRYRNSQQNTRKVNLTICKKDHTSRLTWIYSRVTSMIQHSKSINVIHYINHGNNIIHMIISIDAKKHLTNSTSIHDENSHQSGYRENKSQHNKSCLQQIHSQHHIQL